MFSKSSPLIEVRYWTALCIASICGANLGDFFPDMLHVSRWATLAILAAAFLLLALVQRFITSGELLFWGSILAVRATATDIADFSISEVHLSYAGSAATFAVALIAMMGVAGGFSGAGDTKTTPTPRVNAAYWLGMLVAGTLGTVIADGVGHAFGSVKIGVPIAAVAGTILLAAAFWGRQRVSRALWSYWLVVVVIRAWGTSIADIAAFLLSLPVSLTLAATALVLVLLAWRPTQTQRLAAEQA